MPLSEDEQRILRDIERNFYENDPAFAEAVGNTAPYRHARRNTKLAVLGFVVSLALMLLTFTKAAPLGFLGFLGMVACTFVVVQNVRRIGAVGLADANAQAADRAQKVNTSLTDAKDKFRKRFKSE